MKRVIRTMIFAGLSIMMLGCAGNNKKKDVADMPAQKEETPKVAVIKVQTEDVPYNSTYTSSVLPMVKNNIAPQAMLRIEELMVEIGDFVKKGQIVAELDKLQYEQAMLQMNNKKVELERLKTLYDGGGISKSDFEAIELAYKVSKTSVENLLKNTTLRSPVDGVITARKYDEGDMFSMSMPIYVVEQISPVKLLVGISESDYTKIKKGDSVKIFADAFPNKEFAGKISMIYPTINPTTHTFIVEVQVPNRDKVLRPGMFTKVEINFGTNNSVVIPDIAVVKQAGAGNRFVYVLNEDSTVTFKEVKLGRRMGDRYEILEGIEDGATIVTEGQVRLKDGIKVEIGK